MEMEFINCQWSKILSIRPAYETSIKKKSLNNGVQRASSLGAGGVLGDCCVLRGHRSPIYAPHTSLCTSLSFDDSCVVSFIINQ